jgi:hypothetical protein
MSNQVNQVVIAQFRSLSAGGAIVLLVALSMSGADFSAAAQEPKVVVIDAPGADSNPGDQSGTYPSAINSAGAITGPYQDASGTYHGFVRSSRGEYTTFDAPGADLTPGDFNGTSPSAINDLGVVTGLYWDANGFSHGFLRNREGKFASFDVPGVGGFGSVPQAINLEGAVSGYYADANDSIHPFVRSPDGKFSTWTVANACTGNGSQGCYGTGATNINAIGTIAGGFEDNSGNFVHHSLLRSPDGKLKTIDVPGAGTGSYQGTGCPGCAMGLNQLGAMAGIYSDANSVNHGFVRSPTGKITTFDAPGAGTDSYEGTGCFSDCPVAINNWGAITGVYIDASFTYHEYLCSPNGKITTIDPPGSTFTFPGGMNDRGEITGYYLDGNNVVHGFLRFPD